LGVLEAAGVVTGGIAAIGRGVIQSKKLENAEATSAPGSKVNICVARGTMNTPAISTVAQTLCMFRNTLRLL
jgi:hypothetical protein